MKKLGKKFEKFPVRYAVTIFDGNAAVQNFKRDFNWRVGKSILKNVFENATPQICKYEK